MGWLGSAGGFFFGFLYDYSDVGAGGLQVASPWVCGLELAVSWASLSTWLRVTYGSSAALLTWQLEHSENQRRKWQASCLLQTPKAGRDPRGGEKDPGT